MKEGYYVSAYVEISKTAYILFDSNRHDQGIALWNYDGTSITLLHYWELERLTGVKQHRMAFYDEAQFIEVLDQLLMQYGLTSKDIIEIWGLKNHCYNPNPEYTFHCMSHLFASVLSESEIFFQKPILAFVLDGGSDVIGDIKEEEAVTGKYQYCSAYFDQKNGITCMERAFSPAVLWNIASIYYGMREGSLMALANASTSRLLFEVDEILISDHVKKDMEKYEKLIDFFDSVNQMTMDQEGILFDDYDDRFSERENKISMVMKVIQKMSQDIMDKNVQKAVEKHGIKPEDTYLAMTGGFALNCPCNTYLMKKYDFKGFLSVPNVSDSGMALGIGLYTFYAKLGNEFKFSLGNAYHGDEFDAEQFLHNENYKQFIQSVQEFDPETVVADIIKGPIVWFYGRAEIGPRALGNRSILGDPRSLEAKDRLNEIKQRQWWRPVAPIVLYDAMGEWFEDTIESPYMLHAIQIKKEKQELVKAIVHMDGSARVQTITKEEPASMLEQVLRAFYKETGVPILCNTSLNDKGEPIIDSIEEAVNFALRKGIIHIYVNGTRVTLMNHEAYRQDKPLTRWMAKEFINHEQPKATYLSKLRETGLKKEDVQLIYFFRKIVSDHLLLAKPQQWRKELVMDRFMIKNFRFVQMEFNFITGVSETIKSVLENESREM